MDITALPGETLFFPRSDVGVVAYRRFKGVNDFNTVLYSGFRKQTKRIIHLVIENYIVL